MKKKQIYIYLGVSIFILIASIVLFILDESPAYYSWAYVVFIIGAVSAFISLFTGLYLAHKNALEGFRESVVDWFRFVGMSLMFILIFFMFFFTSATVDGASMETTLEDHQVVLIYHYNYTPKLNDIIIIHITTEQYPNHKGDEDYYVKRIYAMPGDVITFGYDSPTSYKIYVNGEVVKNQYGQEYIARMNENATIMTNPVYSEKDMIEQLLDSEGRVMDGCYLAMGDNERFSLDSRDLGLIHEEDIIGEVIYRLSPLGGLQ